MMIRVSLLMSFVAACAVVDAPQPTSSHQPGSKTTGNTSEVTIAFNSGGTGSETTSGQLVAGSTIQVTYDLLRLGIPNLWSMGGNCDAANNGIPEWGVTGYAQFSDGTTTTFAVTQVSGTQVVSIPGQLALPADATSVVLWFEQTDIYGCVDYDSNQGVNYTFGIAGSAAQVPLLYFSTDASAQPTQSAEIYPGGQVEVDYEPNRMPECAAMGSSNPPLPAWGITLYWQVDGGTVNSIAAAQVSGSALVAADPIITIPASSQDGDLAMWFESTNIYGCVGWDSEYGANYQFPIE